MSGRIILAIWEKGWRFPGFGPPSTLWPFMVSLETPKALMSVPFNVLMYYNEHIMRLKIYLGVESFSILDLVGYNQFMLHPQGLCHSFKDCALPSSLLFQDDGIRTLILFTYLIPWRKILMESLDSNLDCWRRCRTKAEDRQHHSGPYHLNNLQYSATYFYLGGKCQEMAATS